MGDQIELRARFKDKRPRAVPGRWWELDHIGHPAKAHLT